MVESREIAKANLVKAGKLDDLSLSKLVQVAKFIKMSLMKIARTIQLFYIEVVNW